MATVQDVRDFTAWHDGMLFHLRNIVIPAIRRGAIDDAHVCLARRAIARRPNVSLGAMAEANSNELLGTHPLDIDGMTAHAVVGQLAERLMLELREIEHARELKGDLQTQRDELQELCRQLDEFDWDDLDRRLPRESTRMIGRMESANDVQKSELSSTGTATTPEASKSSTDRKPKKATVNATGDSKPDKPNVVADAKSDSYISIGTDRIQIDYDHAVYLKALVETGDWLSDPEFRASHPDYETDRQDRWRKKLPRAVAAHIETTSRGSRWVDAPMS